MDPEASRKLNLTSNVIYRHLSEEELESKKITLESGEEISLHLISKEFKVKINSLNSKLISFLRASLWPEYRSKLDISSKNFSITIPTDLRFERLVFKHYIKIFNAVLLNFKRDSFQDIEFIKQKGVDNRLRMIRICELGYKQIAEEHVRLGRLVLEILQEIKSRNEVKFKALYMNRVAGVDGKGKGEVVRARLKIANYLKSFHLSKWLK